MRTYLSVTVVLLLVLAANGFPRPVSNPRSPPPTTPARQHVKMVEEIGGAGPGLPDTTWFGGTHWDLIDQRWEALINGIWTFDTGIASSINSDSLLKPVGLHSMMEGWTGFDRTAPLTIGVMRRLQESDFAGAPGVCVGDAAGMLGGDWSFWAGLIENEAVATGFASGQGYGDSWNVNIDQTFFSSGAPTSLSFSYIVDVEPGFDFVYVRVDTGGSDTQEITIWAMDGTVSGRDTLILTPGNELPMGPGNVTITFRVDSDGGWSDEDGLYPTTCGAFAVDDIVLTGGITYSTDFETGEDGWAVSAVPVQGTGKDWSDIRAVSDLPPDSAAIGCDLGDSVLVFIDDEASVGYHSCVQNNIVISPWIDLRSMNPSDITGFMVEYGGFYRQWAIQVLMIEAQWFPLVPGSPESGSSAFTAPGGLHFLAPPLQCAEEGNRLAVDFTGTIPVHADAVRLGIGMRDGCLIYFCDCFSVANSTPWFDDIRFGVLLDPGAVVGIGEKVHGASVPILGDFYPNPLLSGSQGSLSFYLTSESRAHIEVFDVAGRLVANVFDGIAPKGWTLTSWDGTNTNGIAVQGGVYFYRLVAGAIRISKRVVLLRN